nr:hypothetical protein [Variovorax boronicumulans]
MERNVKAVLMLREKLELKSIYDSPQNINHQPQPTEQRCGKTERSRRKLYCRNWIEDFSVNRPRETGKEPRSECNVQRNPEWKCNAAMHARCGKYDGTERAGQERAQREKRARTPRNFGATEDSGSKLCNCRVGNETDQQWKKCNYVHDEL